ncbi:CaiB/BaiF CoA-transferase family protein [Aurantiacibacter poecillastricola]|uniref:CaiB/BaiF CoA-transferase family protein n=1 Tax=Aurantiacibacter poecillastricola TaxID=3064385 RepID=UPI0027400F0E|nr:CoA transferase [Aurantiacibacter sp. 219JJ12-13]MDP5261308.1 CoA transferase [Aurantiacibacter sp. 219JJ12-13]
MSFLEGHRVAVLGDMQERPLTRYLASLGAEIGGPVEGASFVIDDLGLEAAAGIGIPDSAVHVSVTPFGSGGPRSSWRGGELVSSAMGGALRLTGKPGEKPVKEAGDACTFHADMVAAAGAMAAHFARGTHGKGQHVDVSIQQVAMSRNVNGVLVWQFDRRKLDRAGQCIAYGRAKVRVIWKLADGYCFHALMSGRLGAPANQALSEWMDETGIDNPMRDVDWLAYNRSTLPEDVRDTWQAAMAQFFASRTKEEIATEGRRRGINACVVNEPADVLEDEHLRARGFLDTPSGLPERFAVVREGATSSAPAIHAGKRSGPLSGVKVLDFAWALVGSITTKTLGDLGAEVVKIESRSRPDLARIDVQVSASSAESLDDKPWFANLNTSKRSLTLDLKKPASREVLNPLIDWADVVVENFSPGTMAKLGLDYDSLIERNPGLVMVSGSVFGQTGPLAQEWGVDGTGGALSGRTFLTGYPDGEPVIPGAVPYGDVIVPYVMAGHVAAALQRRRETGTGCHIDASMYEICVQQMREFLASAKSGERPQRLGNADPAVYFQDVFPSSGVDRWVAISCLTADEYERLVAITGPEIAEWTSRRTDYAAAEELQAAGLAAGALQDCEDLLERDPQIAGRSALWDIDHAVLGTFGHIATPIAFSADRLAPYRAPSMGEHAHEIAREIAGLSEEEISRLEQDGVFK